MRKSLILFSLILLVFLAGCIGQPTEEIPGIATGVVIKTFSPDIPEIFSGDSITFYLSLENIGEEDATDVDAKLFGLGTDWVWDSGKVNISDELSKSQPDYEIPGGIADYTWDATSPSGLKVDNDYTVGVRVYYSYKTTALGNIKVYSEDYLSTLPFEEAQNIRKASGLASFTVTDAPIRVELAGVARPIIYRGGTQSASVMIQMSNLGQGYAYDTAEDDREITIEEIKVANATCVSRTTDVKLPRIGKKSVTCSFTIPPSGVTITEYTTIPIEVKLSYNYFIDGSSSIKVLQEI